MLSFLRVSGFALIEKVELTFGPGLTVITGETGAGKSILVEALALLRGGRASAELIRAGSDEAEVEAMFDWPARPPVRTELAAHGRRASGEGLVVRRMIARSGRGRAHLGGGLATLAELAGSVGTLVDITSQHDQQSLMDPDSQLAILDAFADNADRLGEARAAWQALSAAREDLAGFEAEARTRAEREDYLRFQLRELEEAAPEPGRGRCPQGRARTGAGGGEVPGGVLPGRRDALLRGRRGRRADRRRGPGPGDPGHAGHHPGSPGRAPAQRPGAGRGRGRRSGPAAPARALRSRAAGADRRTPAPHRPARPQARRHPGRGGRAPPGLAAELGALGSFEEGLAARRAAVARRRRGWPCVSEALTERRRKSARALGKQIDETLRELGLRDAAVKVVLEDRGGDGPRGRDRARFMFAPNLGEEPAPLARIASGGELSRVMLAVKRALAQSDRALTYVFDEVDTGVGGGTAEVIGRKLKAIAADRQVLAVTHLPQIAAFADQHIKVEKAASNGRTAVRIDVSIRRRAAELARMLGGTRPSREAAAHASEMLRRAR